MIQRIHKRKRNVVDIDSQNYLKNHAFCYHNLNFLALNNAGS
jgi:hypothetical protein